MDSREPESAEALAVRNMQKAWRFLLESEPGARKLASVTKQRDDSREEAEAVLLASADADSTVDEVDSVCLAALIAARWADDFYYGVGRAFQRGASASDPTARMTDLLGSRGALSASVALDVWTARAATARAMLEESEEWKRVASISAAMPKSLYMTVRGVSGHPADAALGFAIRTRNRFALALADPVPGAEDDAASIMAAANIVGSECEEIGLEAIVAGWWRIMLFDADHIGSPLSEEEREALEAGIDEQRARWGAAATEAPARPMHPAADVYQRLSGTSREVLLAFVVDSRPSMTGEEVVKRINLERAKRRIATGSSKPENLSADPMKRPVVRRELLGQTGNGSKGPPKPVTPPESLLERVPSSRAGYRLTDVARGMREQLASVLGRDRPDDSP